MKCRFVRKKKYDWRKHQEIKNKIKEYFNAKKDTKLL